MREVEACCAQDEHDHGPDQAEKTDVAQVFEEIALPHVESGGEDDGREDVLEDDVRRDVAGDREVGHLVEDVGEDGRYDDNDE